MEVCRKTCPYCGQVCIVKDESEAAEMICGCPGASMFRLFEENTMRLMAGLTELFGEGCAEATEEFVPVTEEVFAILSQVAEKVGHAEMGAVTFQLPDGTAGKISTKGIERKKNIVRKQTH